MSLLVVVEQLDGLRNQLRSALLAQGYRVSAFKDDAGLPELLRRSQPDLIVVGGVADDPFASIETIRKIKLITQAPVVFLPQHSSESIAIAALRLPVSEYLPPPVRAADVVEVAGRLLAQEAESFAIVGSGGAVGRLKTILSKVARNNCNILITGETGTGKELIAQHIHLLGPRRAKPFIAVNCAAIPDTLLESELFGYERGAFTGAARRRDGLLHAADGGTLFLDEIGDMSMVAQSKILRAIETGRVQRVGAQVTNPVDVRFVAATNQVLEGMVQDGRFRADLYFRVNVARIDLPPLRERPEDIPLLIRHFLDESAGSSISVSAEALSLLTGYGWPGNIRELRNVIQATLVYLSDSIIRVEDLPEALVRAASGATAQPQSERNRLLAVLEQTHWNKSRAAESLQWSRMTLYRKMAKHRVDSHRPKSAMTSRARQASA